MAYAQLMHEPLFPAEVARDPSLTARFEERTETTRGGVTWEPFSPERLDASVREGRTVFLDLTADWCWTCKVNERTVLADDEVEAAFLANEVLALKGDWTRKDPRITEILRRHNRAGVPFYAVYPADRPDEPIVLPEIINKRLVLESLEKAGPSRNGA
jgi:thiol:disulfide interchange protein DsbD